MRNFIIFFTEKEGTSPLVHLLDNFEQISIIHQVDSSEWEPVDKAWEPFDRKNCGSMPLRSLERSLDIIYNKEPIDFKRLNQIYTRTARRPFKEFSRNGVVGFKMRFTPPRKNFPYMAAFSPWNRLSKIFMEWPFRRMMINLLRRNDVVVFLAVRQDVLRWGLSKYHGDGTGKPGHLQFKIANGEISKEEIGKIYVDCKRLEEIILKCEKILTHKHQLMEEFKLAGIQAYPLCYEDFLTDKQKIISEILDLLELEISKEEIDTALKEGVYFKKVHSDDILDFVENHEEVKEKFGNRFVSWC
ncbi:MAG: hypothetical protein ACE5KZ_04155 [Candidatus Scalinduaceae bacterium]